MAESSNPVRLTRAFTKALAANANTASFPSRIPTVTTPTNDGVTDFRAGGGIEAPEWMTVIPYGVGADEDAFSVRVIGWRRIGGVGPIGSYLWVPTTLCEMACTLGTAAGIAGAPVLNTELFADTITVVTEPTLTAVTTRQGTVELFNPADNTVAYFRVKLCGVEKVEFTFDQTTNTPTMNCLLAPF